MFDKLNFFTSRVHRQKKSNLLPVHTDIHAHLIPGIDDGARDVDSAAELALGLEELGIRRIILTPHITEDIFPNTPQTIDPPFQSLKHELKLRNSRLRLDASAEYRIDSLLFDQLKSQLIRPMPGDFILIECGWREEPFGLTDFVHELKEKYNLRPVLAHPERYPYYHTTPNRYSELRQAGLMFQINLLSLTGYYGKTTRNIAKEMMENNMVEFVGSDLHRANQLVVIREYLNSKESSLLMRCADNLLNDSSFPE